MSRYIRAASGRLYAEDHTFDEERPMLPDIVVSEHVAVDTGLLWSDGAPVLRAPNPIGFGRSEDWS